MSEQLIIPNVYGIITNATTTGERSVLLQRRWKPESDPVNTGGWELPGGKWRAWEPIGECLRREVFEESGVDVMEVMTQGTTSTVRGQIVHATRSASVVQMLDGPYPSVITVIEARGSGDPVEAGDGSRNARWMPLAELRRRLTTEPDEFTPLSHAAISSWLDRIDDA